MPITDPQAEERIHDVVGLYLNPPTNVIVLSFDENPGPGADSAAPAGSPGTLARQTYDHRRAGVTSLYAALEIASGRVIGKCQPAAKGIVFLELLKTLAGRFRTKQLHVIIDNFITHAHRRLGGGQFGG